jgi:predicted DNA-binding antitoxin AbrB/MazE fold protein
MAHQFDRSREGELMSISNIILIGLSIQFSISEGALPDAAPYFEALRQHLAVEYRDEPVLNGYTYHLKRTLAEVANNGKLNPKEVEEYDAIYKNGLPLRKVVSKNGKPLKVKRAEEQKFEPVRRPSNGPEAIIQANKVAEDVLRVVNLKLVRREMVGNRPAIVVELSPRTNAKPLTPRGKEFLSRIEGEAWVDETDHVVSRVSWRFLEGSGGNPLLKAEKGGEVTQEWLKFRDEVWLPAFSERHSTLRFFFEKRIPLLRRDEYSEYKEFVSETTIEVI